MKDLQDKVAIVTGGGSGIGEAIALLFAREGARVVVSDIDEDGGQRVASQIKGDGGEAIFVKADNTRPEDHKTLVARALETYDALHVAVNNAGIGGPLAPTGEYPIEGWQRVIDTNLSGAFYGMRHQIPAMQQSGGSIINMASILGQVGTRFSPAYVASKHGVVGLTKAAALEHASQKIRINAIGPGYINTPLVMNALDEDTREQLVGLHPLGRLGESAEVAELALWLASDRSSFATGAYYPIDGGYLAQ